MTDNPTYGQRPVSPRLDTPQQVLCVRDGASRAEIEDAYRWLFYREVPASGGYSQRIARLDAARLALLAGAV
jgi:hypothetical protein